MASKRARKVSLQYLWQLRAVKAGRCRVCNKKRGAYARLCDRCQDKRRKYDRRRTGNKPWRKGGVGSPIRAPWRPRKRAA